MREALIVGAVVFLPVAVVRVNRRRRRRQFDETVLGLLADYEEPWLDVKLRNRLETVCDRTVSYDELFDSVDRLQSDQRATAESRAETTNCGRELRWYFTATKQGRKTRRC